MSIDSRVRIEQTSLVISKLFALLRLELAAEPNRLLKALHKIHEEVEAEVRWADEMLERYPTGR